MENDVFDDDDGVIDNQTDRSGESTEGHQVEAFADDPKEEDGDGDCDRDDEAGDERRAPVAKEEKEDDAGEHKADEDGVTHTLDAFPHQRRLIVVGFEVDAGGKFGAKLIDLGAYRVCDGDSVAARLPCDVEQHGIFSVGRDAGVDGQGGVLDGCHVPDAYGRAAGCSSDGELPKLFEAMHLGADETEHELVVLLVETG